MVVAATAQIGVVEQGGRTAFFGRRVVALAGEERGDALAIERAEFEGSKSRKSFAAPNASC